MVTTEIAELEQMGDRMCHTYEELIAIGLDAARNFARLHPGHIGAKNAIRELERESQHKAKLRQIGRKEATIVDPNFVKRSVKGRCPTKRALR